VRGTRRFASAVVAIALAAGCGYKLAGTGSFLPKNIKSIAIAPFENRSARPEIEVRTTEAVAREMSRRGGFKVVSDRATADALLEGVVTDFRTTPVQFNSQGRATRVETAVVLRASLREVASGQLLWSQSNLVFRDQYDVQQSDINYFDLETLAMDALARGAAQTLVNSLTEGF
jgi:TolB-like protein